MERTPTLDDVGKELRCVYLRWSTMHEKDHNAIMGDDQNHGMEISVGE